MKTWELTMEEGLEVCVTLDKTNIPLGGLVFTEWTEGCWLPARTTLDNVVHFMETI